MNNLVLTLLMIPMGLCAQWPEYDIGTTLDFTGVSVKSDGDILLSGNLGTLLKSSDCGLSWTEIETGYVDDLGRMQFLNETLGYLLADDGYYGKSTDGGESWVFSNTAAPDDLEALYFLNDSIGYMVGKDGGIIRTLNGGTSWTLLPSGTSERLQGVFFTDENHGVVAGRNETLLKTSDGGDTWIPIFSGVNDDLSNIWFTDSENGFICAEGGLYQVNQDLSSIEFIAMDPNVEMSDIFFIDENVGWACGEAGTAFVTNNGGGSWTEVELEGMPFDMNSIHGNSLNSVFTVGSIGKVNGLCTSTSLDFESLFIGLQVSSTDSGIELKFDDLMAHELLHIELIDICGKIVLDRSYLRSSETTFIISKPQTSGIYFVRVSSGDDSVTAKLYSH